MGKLIDIQHRVRKSDAAYQELEFCIKKVAED